MKDGRTVNLKESDDQIKEADRYCNEVRDSLESSKLAVRKLQGKNVTDDEMRKADEDMEKMKELIARKTCKLLSIIVPSLQSKHKKKLPKTIKHT